MLPSFPVLFYYHSFVEKKQDTADASHCQKNVAESVSHTKKDCCATGKPADTTASETSVLIGLFKCNLSSLSLKFSFDVLRLSFGCALFNNLRSTINDSFSLFKSKTCNLTNNFDNFNFVRAYLCKLYVKLIFLLSCLACCTCFFATTTPAFCGNTELFLTSFYKVILTLIQIIL